MNDIKNGGNDVLCKKLEAISKFKTGINQNNSNLLVPKDDPGSSGPDPGYWLPSEN